MGKKKERKKEIRHNPNTAKFPVIILKNKIYLLQKKKKFRPEAPTLGILSKDRLLSVCTPSYVSTVILLCFCPYVQQASEQEIIKATDLPYQFQAFLLVVCQE